MINLLKLKTNTAEKSFKTKGFFVARYRLQLTNMQKSVNFMVQGGDSFV